MIVFALAEGDYSDEERQLVEALAGRAGVTAEELAELTARAQAGDDKLSLSRDPDKAKRTIEFLVAAAAADRVVTDAERRLLVRIARHTGLDESVVTELVGRAMSTVAVDDAEVERRLEDIYANFTGWDAATRGAKLHELASYGHQAVEPLLHLLESYRVPDGAANALELKCMVAAELGELADGRAVYYLVQQVSIGELDDEVTCSALRHAAAGALGKITGQPFAADDDGVAAARAWWTSGKSDRAQIRQAVAVTGTRESCTSGSSPAECSYGRADSRRIRSFAGRSGSASGRRGWAILGRAAEQRAARCRGGHSRCARGVAGR